MKVKQSTLAVRLALACIGTITLGLVGCGGGEPMPSVESGITATSPVVQGPQSKNDSIHAAAVDEAAEEFVVRDPKAARAPARVQYAQDIIASLNLKAGGVAASGMAVQAAVVSDAHIKGAFEAPHNWPIMPIAVMLLPDGRVLAYGTDPLGNQTGLLHYAVWDPTLGTSAAAFMTLPNTTNTDIFCAAQALIPSSGNALLLGGDIDIGGVRNNANSDVNTFDPSTNALTRRTPNMNFKRWYATAVTLPNGEHVVMGGQIERPSTTYPKGTYAITPEVRNAAGNWRLLTGGTSEEAFGKGGGGGWNYPRAWVDPRGKVFTIAPNGTMHLLDTAGAGTITKYPTVNAGPGHNTLDSIMYAPGRILSVRKEAVSVIVDINNVAGPTVTPTTNKMIAERRFGSLAVLADGKVWMNGGSPDGNIDDVTNATLDSELWNPNTKVWSVAARASTPRLYHSVSLLLPDATVLTGGGGAPGPITQMNGEIYVPPYLFKKDGSGQRAVQPVITTAFNAVVGWNKNINVTVGGTDTITRVTLVRAGAATHDFNNEARFFNLAVATAGKTVTVKTPANGRVAPPGAYMLFAWNAAGVPSKAKMIRIGPAT